MNKERLALIREMLEQSPEDAFLQYAAALEYHKAGDAENAIRQLEELLRTQPDYLAAYYQLGKLYEEKGQAHIAIRHYKQGKIIALQQNDKKTLGELNEALMMLDAEEEDF